MATFIDPNPKSTITLVSSDGAELITNTNGVCLSEHLDALVKDCFPDKIKVNISTEYVEKISDYMNGFEDENWVKTFIRENEKIISKILETEFSDIALLQKHFETYNYIILKSGEMKVKVRYNGAMRSKIIADMMDDFYTSHGMMIGVDPGDLSLVAEYMNHYDDPGWVQRFIDDALIVKEYRDKRGLDKTDINDTKIDRIIKASDFLDIPDLMEVACQKMADLINNKTPAWIRDYFELSPDFTFAQKEKAKVNTKWHYKGDT